MKVECVHLFFQSIYVGNQLFFSVPVADIAVKGKTLPRRVPLDRQLITQKNVREIHIGGNFFAVKTTSAFVIYSASGKRLDVIPLCFLKLPSFGRISCFLCTVKPEVI